MLFSVFVTRSIVLFTPYNCRNIVDINNYCFCYRNTTEFLVPETVLKVTSGDVY